MEQTSRRIGPYEIRDQIGQSPFYTTYVAFQPEQERFVALKVAGRMIASDPALTDLFVEAGRRAARLQHRNIVPVYEAGIHNDIPYIAAEYVDGVTLRRWLDNANGRLSPATASAVVQQIAAALDYAHRHGVLHRELHADNVFVTDEQRVLVSDFLLADVKAAAGGGRSADYVHTADLPFLAPEQIRTNAAVKETADVYSLGVLTYNMLTGGLPFSGDDPDSLRRAIVHQMPVLPETANPDVPPGMAYVLKCVLAKEPEMRYASATDFAVALQEGQMWIPGTSAAEGALAAGGRRQAGQGGWAARNRIPLFLLLALAAVVVAMLALLQTSPGLTARMAALVGRTTEITIVPAEDGVSGPAASATDDVSVDDDPGQGDAGDSGDSGDNGESGESGEVGDSGVTGGGAGDVGSPATEQPTEEPIETPTETPTQEPTQEPNEDGAVVALAAQSTPTGESTAEPETEPTADPEAEASTEPTADADAGGSAGADGTNDGDTDDDDTDDDSADENDAVTTGSSTVLLVPTRSTNSAGADAARVDTAGDEGTGDEDAASAVTPDASPRPTDTITPRPTRTNTPRPTSTPRPTATETAVPTATNTPRPTNTNTPEPTATALPTATPRPTSTNTPPPTRTDTPVPTATNTALPTATPRPTSTNTAAPTATTPPTATPRPTLTATRTPRPTLTATRTPRPTSTNTPAAVAQAVLPTPTFTPRATDTATPAPTATNTPAPSSTPLPTFTATNTPPPTSTNTPVPTSTNTVVPTATPIPVSATTLQLIRPGNGTAGGGEQAFEWATTITPGPDQAFELVFWPVGEDPMARGFGLAAPTTGNRLNVDLSNLDRVLPPGLLEPGNYYWGLLLVTTEPYERIQFLGQQYEFQYVRNSGDSSSSADAPPSGE